MHPHAEAAARWKARTYRETESHEQPDAHWMDDAIQLADLAVAMIEHRDPCLVAVANAFAMQSQKLARLTEALAAAIECMDQRLRRVERDEAAKN